MGKSISHSLEDDDDELIQTTRGPPSSGLGSPQSLRREPSSTQERPPSSIFKTDPSTLTSGYLRRICTDTNHKITDTIYTLCCAYYASKYKSLVLDADNIHTKALNINNIDDCSYDNIDMGHDTSIVGKKRILKLSSINNLKMDWNSKILMEQNIKNKNGTIIVTVFGDINMNKHTQLMCETDGNIYIQCNNLIMRTGSVIATVPTSVDKHTIASATPQYSGRYRNRSGDDHDTVDLKRFGNIYMKVHRSLIMDKGASIKSGNIKIECQQAKIGEKSEISAMRKNLEIIAQNGIIIDDDNVSNVLYAKKQRKIVNKNELNNDATKIKEIMKENIDYKLTMFEGDDNEEFECVICWDNTPNIMILPCHHSTFCEPCIKELNPTECPICRAVIVGNTKF